MCPFRTIARFGVSLLTALSAVGGASNRAHGGSTGCSPSFSDPVPSALPSAEYVYRFAEWDRPLPAAADSAVDSCEALCQEEADAALQACLADGQTPTQCLVPAQELRSACLVSVCDLPPFQPPCELTCHLKAQHVFQACRNLGHSDGECTSVARGTLNDCLSGICGLTPVTSPCVFGCHQAAEQVFQQCIESGDGHDQCTLSAREKLNACLEDDCHVPAPERACVTACHRQAEQMFRGCVEGGATHVACAEAARGLMESCQRVECGLPPLPPPCETRCEQDGEDVYYDCLESDLPQAQCADVARTVREECLEGRCGVDPNCGAYCPRKRLLDAPHDAISRRRDRRSTSTMESLHEERSVELLETSIGAWAPTNPAVDLFVGQYRSTGAFVRLELRFAGLVNPPGSLEPSNFKPHTYGPRPVYGFVEIDLDGNLTTGGELDAPQYRYFGNVARFGGQVVAPGQRNRVALDVSAFDRNFLTPPFVERSGEEFHLALLGGEAVTIQQLHGDGDGLFERGEAWLIAGAYFHRAHGYERFSMATGGRAPGQYMPLHKLLFAHDVIQNVTIVSVVFPLTNAGAAQMTGRAPEPMNNNPSDQASVLEGLLELHDSAVFVSVFPTADPAQTLITGWETEVPSNYLNPNDWKVSVIVGTNHPMVEPSQAFFVWTDVSPNVTAGDVDGSAARNDADSHAIRAFIVANDGRDSRLDAAVVVRDFASGFSLFDVNYDGVVDGRDIIREDGDADVDGDIDLADFATQQSCFGRAGAFTPCVSVNFNGGDTVDLDDVRVFGWSLLGPRGR